MGMAGYGAGVFVAGTQWTRGSRSSGSTRWRTKLASTQTHAGA